MPPRYVNPYVKRNKKDAADAEAICEAVTRPNMPFGPSRRYATIRCRYSRLLPNAN
jgi:transposase